MFFSVRLYCMQCTDVLWRETLTILPLSCMFYTGTSHWTVPPPLNCKKSTFTGSAPTLRHSNGFLTCWSLLRSRYANYLNVHFYCAYCFSGYMDVFYFSVWKGKDKCTTWGVWARSWFLLDYPRLHTSPPPSPPKKHLWFAFFPTVWGFISGKRKTVLLIMSVCWCSVAFE